MLRALRYALARYAREWGGKGKQILRFGSQ